MTSKDGSRECAWCHQPFRAPASRGPAPRYCSPAHRQRAYEVRRAGAEAFATAIAMPTEMADAVKAAVNNPALAEVMKGITMPPALADAMKSAMANPALTEAMKAAAGSSALADAVRSSSRPPVLYDAMRNYFNDPALAEAMRVKMPPAMAASLKAALANTALTDAMNAKMSALTANMNASLASPAIAEAMKGYVIPPALADAMKGFALSPKLTEAMRRLMLPQTDFSAFWRETTLDREDCDPPNWPAEVSWDDMWQLMRDTGWSLINVPRPAVIEDLLKAEPSRRADVLLGRQEEVIEDCRNCFKAVVSTGTGHLIDALGQALDAYEAGLCVPAQTAAASVLADVISRVLKRSFTAATAELAKDPYDMPMVFARFWLIASMIPAALSRFWPQKGDLVPDTFNRHAVAHTVDPRQFTRLNALVGLMLVTGLVREIADEIPKQFG